MNGQLNGPRNAIEIRRLVLPVLHGIESGWNQHPGAADGARLDYVSILVDERVDLDVALDPGLHREEWILGRRFVEFPRRFHLSTDVQRPARNNRLRNWSGRRRGGRTSALGDAAKQAADLAAGNSAKYAARNAGDDIRGGFGCGGWRRNFLRYGNRHGQLGCRWQNLALYLPHGTARRGGRRRRRGRNQGSGQIRDFKLMQIDYLGI